MPVNIVGRNEIHGEVSGKSQGQCHDRGANSCLRFGILFFPHCKVKAKQQKWRRNQQPAAEAKESFYIPLYDGPIASRSEQFVNCGVGVGEEISGRRDEVLEPGKQEHSRDDRDE